MSLSYWGIPKEAFSIMTIVLQGKVHQPSYAQVTATFRFGCASDVPDQKFYPAMQKLSEFLIPLEEKKKRNPM